MGTSPQRKCRVISSSKSFCSCLRCPCSIHSSACMACQAHQAVCYMDVCMYADKWLQDRAAISPTKQKQCGTPSDASQQVSLPVSCTKVQHLPVLSTSSFATTHISSALLLPLCLLWLLRVFRDKPKLISDGEKMALLYNIACCHSQMQDARAGLVALAGA